MAGLGRPGPAPRASLPAWKREILERKRAKLAALGGGTTPGPEMGVVEPAVPTAERLVLAESLGPLCENPFMRLESERRRGRRQGATGARAAPPLLELCVPGLRTIRADNILIIESAPGFAPAPAPPTYGGAAAEIRAAEVLVYETAPAPGRVSRLLEKFDPSAGVTLRAPSPPRRRGSPERARPPAPPSTGVPKPPPAVPGPPATPRVGERAAWFEREHRGGGAFAGARRSDFLRKTGSNSFMVHPRGLHRGVDARPLSNGCTPPEPQASPANGLTGAQPGPVTPRTVHGVSEWKPKVESGETLHPLPSAGPPSATPTVPPDTPAPSPASATPNQRHWVSAATSANDSFEIRPAPKPDIETIPPGDLQARALANLRMNSRNSFVFIPKQKISGARPPERRQPLEPPKGRQDWASQPGKPEAQLVPGADGARQRRPLGAELPWSVQERDCSRPATALVDRVVGWQRSPSPPPSPRAADEAEPAQGFRAPELPRSGPEPGRPGLPVTFIDEVDSEEETSQEAKRPPEYRLHPTSPQHSFGPHAHRGNTFTVVPKRKPGTHEEQPSGQASGEARQPDAEEGKAGSFVGSQVALETMLKKRYPTVHEIEVIGGYLALEKSCLTKAGSSRKKMKISFNDKSLQTTFEYPSESSLIQEEEEEDEEQEEDGESEGSGSEGAAEEMHFSLFLPRATFVNSVVSDTPRLPDGSSGLSSYTPKHSVAFSKWQEQMVETAPLAVEPLSKEVMLTPAGQNELSDFRSEPALYF
ncbi:taperin [Rhynchocyon petersi]